MFATTYTTFDVVKAKLKLYSTLLVERYSFFKPLYMGAVVPWFRVPTSALHKVACITNIFQQSWLEIMQCAYGKKHNRSLTLMWCEPPCSTKFNDASVHVFFALVLGR